jgi:hypothetical protein
LPKKRQTTVGKMITDVVSGKFNRQKLATMPQEALAVEYGVSRATAVKAREEALGSIPETPTNSDK